MFRSALLAGVVLAVTALAGEAALAPAAQADVTTTWRITKDHWSEADEQGFSDFVQAIGEADCGTVDACLESDANPYRDTDPNVDFPADCADAPYFLRAYYAWKNGLPFSFQTAMTRADKNDPRGADIRYTKFGNRVTARDAVKTGDNAVDLLLRLRWTVSSGMFRHSPFDDDHAQFTDFYSPKISRDAIRPGTVIYDINGHVAMVYKVEENGVIQTMSAHPDNSLTRSPFGRNFLRSHPQIGAGFKKWRPIKLVDYTEASDGTLRGGRVVAMANSEIPDFSLEQYLGTTPVSNLDDWWQADFNYQGERIDYYEYIRAAMSLGDLAYRPVEELKFSLNGICQDINARVNSVNAAIEEGMNQRPHPKRLPENIYGTVGDWEDYSTPARDARLKVAFRDLYDRVHNFIVMYRSDSKRLKYHGDDMIGDLIETFDEEASDCTITYTNSAGAPVTLSLKDVMDRLFLMSFDPYHCVERRWGAYDPAELATCTDDDIKSAWYDAQQNLRNQIDRTYDVDMSHTIADLLTPPFGTFTGKGVDFTPNYDVRGLLTSVRASAMARQSGDNKAADLR